MNAPDEAYPLSWPAGWPRTPRHKIARAKFGVQITRSNSSGSTWRQKDRVTNYVGRERLLDELRRLGATQACDRWDRVADNMAALAAHVDAIRGQLRWGVGSLEQAFGGYKALPAMGERKLWWQVLGLKETATLAEVEAKRTALLMRFHPDRGGSHGQAADVNAAYDEARRELSAP